MVRLLVEIREHVMLETPMLAERSVLLKSETLGAIHDALKLPASQQAPLKLLPLTSTFDIKQKPGTASDVLRAEDALGFIRSITSKEVFPNSVPVARSRDGRAFHLRGTINMGIADDRTIYHHEISHAIEYHSPKAHEVISGFRISKVRESNVPPISFKQQYPTSSYGKDEVGNEDGWDSMGILFTETERQYTGKSYSDNTEVLSMIVQHLEQHAHTLAERDPKAFRLVVGMLRGTGLK